MGSGSLMTAHGNTAYEFGGQAHTQECDTAAHSLNRATCSVYFPGPFVHKDPEFHFPRSGQLLSVALETGVHCLGCKLCFVSRCLRFESRIDPSEAVGFLLALISYLPDAPFVVEVSKEQASLILRFSFLVPGSGARQQRKRVKKSSCVPGGGSDCSQ